MLLSLIRMIQAFRERRRTVAQLSQLSDRELVDIGLSRADIQRVAAGNYMIRRSSPRRSDSMRTAK